MGERSSGREKNTQRRTFAFVVRRFCFSSKEVTIFSLSPFFPCSPSLCPRKKRFLFSLNSRQWGRLYYPLRKACALSASRSVTLTSGWEVRRAGRGKERDEKFQCSRSRSIVWFPFSFSLLSSSKNTIRRSRAPHRRRRGRARRAGTRCEEWRKKRETFSFPNVFFLFASAALR